MCGYLGNVHDSPLAKALMDTLGMSSQASELRNNPGTGPASLIDVILQRDGERSVRRALWWLLLECGEDGKWKASKYTSFNTRSDKLDVKRSAGYRPYRSSRCIVPATYIIEGDGAKGERRYHRIEPHNIGFALGGLYRSWVNKETGEELLSCSVITLPPHRQMQQVHAKSTPLFLPTDDPALLDRWLDPEFDDVDQFQHLLDPHLPEALTCTPIKRPGDQQVTGPALTIQ